MRTSARFGLASLVVLAFAPLLLAQKINVLVDYQCDPESCSNEVYWTYNGDCMTSIAGTCSAGNEPGAVGGVIASYCREPVFLTSGAEGGNISTYAGYTLMGYVAGHGWASHTEGGTPYYVMNVTQYCNLETENDVPPPVPC
jgi:hypothetical protein